MTESEMAPTNDGDRLVWCFAAEDVLLFLLEEVTVKNVEMLQVTLPMTAPASDCHIDTATYNCYRGTVHNSTPLVRLHNPSQQPPVPPQSHVTHDIRGVATGPSRPQHRKNATPCCRSFRFDRPCSGGRQEPCGTLRQQCPRRLTTGRLGRRGEGRCCRRAPGRHPAAPPRGAPAAPLAPPSVPARHPTPRRTWVGGFPAAAPGAAPLLAPLPPSSRAPR